MYSRKSAPNWTRGYLLLQHNNQVVSALRHSGHRATFRQSDGAIKHSSTTANGISVVHSSSVLGTNTEIVFLPWRRFFVLPVV